MTRAQFEHVTSQFCLVLISPHFVIRISFHSEAQPITALPKSVLNKADVAAAIKVYVEDSERPKMVQTTIRHTSGCELHHTIFQGGNDDAMAATLTTSSEPRWDEIWENFRPNSASLEGGVGTYFKKEFRIEVVATGTQCMQYAFARDKRVKEVVP
ncbi:hypothetical protein B0H13DRAFT_1893842 [Mycena leptocephala]|nr:hypothetical protein B0H13DRAFT_1893842 [Mycena leptocephala]